MRVSFHQKDLEITPALREYLEQKIVRTAEKLIAESEKERESSFLEIEVSRITRHHQKGAVYRVAANLSWNGQMLRASHEDEDSRAACDVVEEELKREIEKHKTRAFSLFKRGARKAKKDLQYDPAARMYRKGRIRDEGN